MHPHPTPPTQRDALPPKDHTAHSQNFKTNASVRAQNHKSEPTQPKNTHLKTTPTQDTHTEPSHTQTPQTTPLAYT